MRLQFEGIHARRRLMVFGAVAVVAIVAAACLPPKPAPVPAAPTTTTKPKPPPPPPTTTKAPPLPPQCPSGTSVLESDVTGSTSSGTTYTAVVEHAGRTRVLTRTADTPADVARFRADAAAQGTVRAFARDGEVHALDSQTETWGFTDTAFRASWAEGTQTSGANVRVAVLDTGVQADHPDLVGHFDPVPGLDLVNLCQNSAMKMVPTPGVTTDPNGHGTHVSGILAASDNGFGVVGGAPGVTLVPVRVLDAGGSGSYANVVAGILWAADKTKGNASVISMSLGGGSDGGVVDAAINTVETDPGFTHPVIVIAAGNTSGAPPEVPASYASTYPQVLPVAALCKHGIPTSTTDRCSSSTETIANFSSHPWSGSGIPTGVSAPGVLIHSTYMGSAYTDLSGTSMATPFVAALAALLVAHCPGDTPTQIVARIEQIAATHDLGAAGIDTTYGFGQIDADTTVKAC